MKKIERLFLAVGAILALVWVAPSAAVEATGGALTETDGYRIHTFTSSADFVVGAGGSVEVLVVGGGGGGAVGSNAPSAGTGGNGGDGYLSAITGVATNYAGGGGGGVHDGGGPGASGGQGGGGVPATKGENHA